MNKEELNLFIISLQKVRKPCSKTFNLGLIIKEPKSKISSDKVLKEIKKQVDSEKIVYDQSTIDEKVIEKIIEAFKNNKWIFLEVKKDVKSLLLNQLQHLANYNSLQLIDYQGKDLREIKMPENSRFIIFAEREIIEKKISYPHFYLLFGGPVLSLK